MTVLLAFLATVGRVLVPFVIQRDRRRILAAGGPDVDVVVRFIALALGGVVVTAFSAYFVNVRLFRSSESGLATLRLKAFMHIHDLSMLTQNTGSALARSSRGSRPTSTRSRCSCSSAA